MSPEGDYQFIGMAFSHEAGVFFTFKYIGARLGGIMRASCILCFILIDIFAALGVVVNGDLVYLVNPYVFLCDLLLR